MRLRAATLALLAIAGCREDVREVEVVFGASMGPIDGLQCRDDDGLLIAQVFDEPEPQACLVIDIVPTDGQPGCRLSELFPWCSSHDCDPDPDLRVRIDLGERLAEAEQMKPSALVDLVKDRLSGTVLFEKAPDTVAILRATIIGQPCDAVDDAPRFECQDVLGCLYSCPVALDSFEGELVLDLDGLSSEMCVRDVRICAADHMFDQDSAMSPCDTDPFAP